MLIESWALLPLMVTGVGSPSTVMVTCSPEWLVSVRVSWAWILWAWFALFPLAVRLATSFPALIAAFCIGGLKEFGEPARKSLIVDLAPDDARARTVGVYYSVRNLVVVPAGIIGGLLWQQAPTLPLEAAFVVGSIGLMVFVLSARGQHSG